MGKRINYSIGNLKKDILLYISTVFGVFFFILFFEPFSIEGFDYHSKLVLISGFGMIILVIMLAFRIFFPGGNGQVLPEKDKGSRTLLYNLELLGIWAFSSVAFAFYLTYVCDVELSFYIMGKVVILCIVPSIVLRLSDAFRRLKSQNEQLDVDKTKLEARMGEIVDDVQLQKINFISENGSEELELDVENILFIRSADNYVEILHQERDGVKKSLFRKTLKNIEIQLRPYPTFLRSHRTCIVNMDHVEALQSNFNTHILVLKSHSEQLPVSRQYLLKIREYDSF